MRYTQRDIQESRQRAVDALLQHGWTLVTDGYQPTLRKRNATVQLRRILKTPFFEPVTIGDDGYSTTLPVKPCKSCGMPIVWAVHGTSKRPMPFDEGKTGDGRWTLATDANKVTASFDAAAPYGHVSHFATCPNADQHRKQGAA